MSYVVGGEIFCSFMLIVILYAALFKVRDKSPRSKYFNICVVLVLAANILDLGTYYLNEHPSASTALTFGVFFFVYAVGFFSEASYCFYIEASLEQKGESVSYRFSKGALLVAAVMSMVFAVMLHTGSVYVEINGERTYAWGFMLTQVVVLIGMIIIMMFTFFHRKTIEINDFFALNSYVVFPFLGVIAAVLTGSSSPVYPCCSISIILVYVMLQTDNERTMEQQNNDLKIESQRDSLTNLLNRRAFDNRCDTIDPESFVGILFLDLNALKYTNDHMGHKAGDELLISLADLLRQNFRGDVIYRISGDEFVVIVEGISEESMKARTEVLRKNISGMDIPIASMGVSYGKGKQIGILLQYAEKKMYVDKNRFYEEHSQYTRKRPGD